MRHTLRAALVKTRATGCFRFALHQPLQHELPKLPQKVPVRVLLSQLEQSILSPVIVVNLRGSGRLDNNHSTETHGGHSHRLRLHHFWGRYRRSALDSKPLPLRLKFNGTVTLHPSASIVGQEPCPPSSAADAMKWRLPHSELPGARRSVSPSGWPDQAGRRHDHLPATLLRAASPKVRTEKPLTQRSWQPSTHAPVGAINPSATRRLTAPDARL